MTEGERGGVSAVSFHMKNLRAKLKASLGYMAWLDLLLSFYCKLRKYCPLTILYINVMNTMYAFNFHVYFVVRSVSSLFIDVCLIIR